MLKLSELFGFTGEAVTVADAGDQFTTDTAEAALQQLAAEVDALEAGGGGGGANLLGTLTQSMIPTDVANITLSEATNYPIVTVAKEIPQTGFINSDWGIETNDTTFDTTGLLVDGKLVAGYGESLDTKIAVTNDTGQIDSSNMIKINSVTPVEADVVATGFNTVLYTGNGTTQSITDVGFTPDLVWLKARNHAYHPALIDSVRGRSKIQFSSITNSEYTSDVDRDLISFDSDGFTLGVDQNGGINNTVDGGEMVAWCWKAGGPAVTNNQGSIESQVSANQELGFSIVSYTGTAGIESVGHGLNKAPKFIIAKNRDLAIPNWGVWHDSIGTKAFLELNTTAAVQANVNQMPTQPDTSVFSTGSQGVMGGYSNNYIAYCFAEIPGFSKFGSYEGNGSTDGPEINCGFKPELIIIKSAEGVATNWTMWDLTRNEPDDIKYYLSADESAIEGNFGMMTSTETGFKIISGNGTTNQNGAKYIYMAFGKKVEAKGAKVFDAVTYTGDGVSGHKIKCGFQPDLVWMKDRDSTYHHKLIDSVRGPSKAVFSSSTSVELVEDSIQSFDSDGITLGTDVAANGAGSLSVAWCWKKDPSVGLDIVQYTGDGVAGKTVSHNLGKKPSIILIKNLDGVNNWVVYHKSTGATKVLTLNQTAEAQVGVQWNNTEPTNIDFTIGSQAAVNTNTHNYIAYVFAEIPGFSKFGSYIGNGSTNGPEIDCGFKPSFVMIKRVDVAQSWMILDTERQFTKPLQANGNNAEFTEGIFFASVTETGFKIEDAVSASYNTSGGNYIYMAFGDTLPAVSEPRGFSTQTYVGDLTAGHEITGIGFQPDLLWIKDRNNAYNHVMTNSVSNNRMFPNLSNAADGITSTVSSLDPDGFTLGASTAVNANGSNIVSWAWKKSPETGLDIVQYTGDGVAGRTVVHNLGKKPGLIIIKNLDNTNNWQVYHKSIPITDYIQLNLDVVSQTSIAAWNDTEPTDNEFTLGASGRVNTNNENYIAYVFSEIKGYSKFGSYVGNGSTTGPVINCGFRPQFVMIKNTSLASAAWFMYDGGRGLNSELYANQTNAENIRELIEFTDNGFKCIAAHDSTNRATNSNNYIFIAFGGNVPAQPSKSSNYALSTDGRTTWQVVGNEKGFEAITYSTNSDEFETVDGVGFAPDLVWSKTRGNASSHALYDTVRGSLHRIMSDLTAAEDPNDRNSLSGFTSDGFEIGNQNHVNSSDHVAWCWKAGGPAVANTDGTITTQVSANQELGFSIVKYTGNATAGATIGHGLGAKPDLVIIKNLATTNHWIVYHNSLGASNALILNLSNASSGTGLFNVAEPDSSVITLGGNVDVNGPQELVAYAWSSNPGFSSFGSYTGNGSTNPYPEINCGFEPAFVMVKRTDIVDDWFIADTGRNPNGKLEHFLLPNSNIAEVTYVNSGFETTPTGFKLKSLNAAGGEYIYIAFAKSVPQSLRNIVRDNAGTWEINTNPAGETWTAASVNTQEGALKEAFTHSFNQMSGDAIKSAGSLLPAPGSTLDVAMEASDELSIENISFNYDMNAKFGYMVQGSDYSVKQTSSTNIEITSNATENFHVKVRG